MRKWLLLFCLLPALALAQGIGSPTPPTHTDPNYLMPAGKIYINTATLANGRAGFSSARAHVACTGDPATTCAGANGAGDLGVFENGAFRIGCPTSHMGFTDPIAWPGQANKNHGHEFFGNSTTSATPPTGDMAAVGTSTCAGGTLNLTAYWVSMLAYHCPNPDIVPCDATRNGSVYLSISNLVYYKGPSLDSTANLVWPAPNFRMISGTAAATMPQGGPHFFFVCLAHGGGSSGTGRTNPARIPTTDDDQTERGAQTYCELNQFVSFPACAMSGVLDSPDHKSHIADIDFTNGCTDASYPIKHPDIAVNVHRLVLQADLNYVRLSSDPPEVTGLTQTSADTTHIKLASSESSTTDFYKYGIVCIAQECRRVTAYDGTTKVATVVSAFSSLPANGSRYAARQPGGTTTHSDWWNGWDQTTVVVNGKTITQIILDKCLKPRADCDAHELKDPDPAHDRTTSPASAQTWWQVY